MLQHGLDTDTQLPDNYRPVRRFARKVVQRLRPGSHTRTIAQETLVLGLETVKESTSAFPPLQSAVGGILKLISRYETMTQNKADRQRLRECASTIQDNLDTAQRSMSSLSGPLPKALNDFTMSVQKIGRDADALVAACKGPFQRYLLARDHKSKISELLARLSEADRNFCRSLALDTNLRVHESRSLELDTNHRVNDIQSTTSAHFSSVQDELRTVKATIADFVVDTDHRVKDIHLVTSTHHDIVRAELHALTADVAQLSQVSRLIGLFAVARS